MKAYNRCEWCGTDPLYQAYHDNEWGKPSYDDRHLFAMLCLEGMQGDSAGLPSSKNASVITKYLLILTLQ